MDHNDVRHMLSEYIDGAVLPEDKTAIEEHLKTCEACNSALKELRQTVDVIRSVEEIDPPAWMTQKIMAKVRVEAGKKSWFQRWFFPLHIKLPLEAIGVLFIAVTAIIIYQNMQPSMKATKQKFMEQDTKEQPAVIAKNEERRAAEPSLRSKELPQSPGYKALDMKQEYEKPAAPMLQNKAAAAPPPSTPAEQPAVSAGGEKKAAYDAVARNDQAFLKKEEAPARGMMQERVTASGAAPEATVKAKQAAPASTLAGAASAGKTSPAIILKVMDMEAAAKEVEKAVTHVHGSIVRRESTGSKTVFVVVIKAQRVGEFKDKLKHLGEVKELPNEGELQKEQMELRIELFKR